MERDGQGLDLPVLAPGGQIGFMTSLQPGYEPGIHTVVLLSPADLIND